MNISSALSGLSAYSLSDVEYVRLTRMGYHDNEISSLTALDYEAIVEKQKEGNREFVSRSGRLNIWRTPVTEKQVRYLKQFGYEFSEEDLETLTDAKVRDFIDILSFAIGNERFIAYYPAWLKSSTRTGRPKFDQADVDRVHEQITAHFKSQEEAE